MLPKTDDTDFSWTELVRRTNNELITAWGNLVHRVLTFAVKHWDGHVPAPGTFRGSDHAMPDQIGQGFTRVGELIDAVQLRAALREAMALVRAVNGYLAQAPWFRVVHAEKSAAATAVYSALQAIDSLTVLLSPFVPRGAERVHGALGYTQPLFGAQYLRAYTEPERTHNVLIYDTTRATGCWRPSTLRPGQPLAWSEPLYKKLDDIELGS